VRSKNYYKYRPPLPPCQYDRGLSLPRIEQRRGATARHGCQATTDQTLCYFWVVLSTSSLKRTFLNTKNPKTSFCHIILLFCLDWCLALTTHQCYKRLSIYNYCTSTLSHGKNTSFLVPDTGIKQLYAENCAVPQQNSPAGLIHFFHDSVPLKSSFKYMCIT
jgi:hypothetical protein